MYSVQEGRTVKDDSTVQRECEIIPGKSPAPGPTSPAFIVDSSHAYCTCSYVGRCGLSYMRSAKLNRVGH